MKFRIKVKREGHPLEWWEEYEREIGQANYVRGVGEQPKFMGDVEAWGKALIEWFNKTRLADDHPAREFVAAEIISAEKSEQ